MADEAIIVELLGNKGDPIRYKIDDSLAIAKGSLMEMKAGAVREVIQSTNVDVPIAGIAAEEKVALDGQTSMSVYTNGIFQMKCVTTQLELGDYASASATDNVLTLSSTLDLEKGWTVGYAMETIATGATGMIRVLK